LLSPINDPDPLLYVVDSTLDPLQELNHIINNIRKKWRF
jgi:hypothetical protein